MASVRVVVSIFEAQRRWLESWHCDVSSSSEGEAEHGTADLLRVLQFDIKHREAKWSYIPLIHITPYWSILVHIDPYYSILIHVNPSHGFVKMVSHHSYQVRLKGGKEAFTWREIKEGLTGKGLNGTGWLGSWRLKPWGFPQELPSRSPSPSPSSTFGCSGFVDLKSSTKNPETLGWIVHVLGGHPRDNDATCSYFTVTACNSSEEREMRERMHKLSRCPKYSFNQFWSIQEHFVKNRSTQFTLPIQVVKRISSCERRGKEVLGQASKNLLLKSNCSVFLKIFPWIYDIGSCYWMIILNFGYKSSACPWLSSEVWKPSFCHGSFSLDLSDQCSQCSCFHLFHLWAMYTSLYRTCSHVWTS